MASRILGKRVYRIFDFPFHSIPLYVRTYVTPLHSISLHSTLQDRLRRDTLYVRLKRFVFPAFRAHLKPRKNKKRRRRWIAFFRYIYSHLNPIFLLNTAYTHHHQHWPHVPLEQTLHSTSPPTTQIMYNGIALSIYSSIYSAMPPPPRPLIWAQQSHDNYTSLWGGTQMLIRQIIPED